jgi:hypothetical protein
MGNRKPLLVDIPAVDERGKHVTIIRRQQFIDVGTLTDDGELADVPEYFLEGRPINRTGDGLFETVEENPRRFAATIVEPPLAK